MKYKLLSLLFLLQLLTASCNKSDENIESIVGQWQVDSRLVSGQNVELSVCDPSLVYEFNSDFTTRTLLINEQLVPENVLCGTYPVGIYSWEEIGTKEYRTFRNNTGEEIANLRIQGSTLVSSFN